MRDTSDVARRLWALCSVLRDEGVTYHEYLNELTWLLFLKLAAELNIEERIPSSCRWKSLTDQSASQVAEHYQEALASLGQSTDPVVRAIFDGALSQIASGEALTRLIRGIDDIDWYRARQNGLGDVYEGLIEKNAQESRYGAGQYFTPRAVVEALVAALSPTPADTVYDPAAGTAGFLVAAGLFAKERNGGQPPTLRGVELVRDVQRLGLMNLLIHDLPGEITLADALSIGPSSSYTVCLTNPPFGVKGSLSAEQAHLLDFPTSNKQLAFVQHVYKNLASGGRAAIVVPDNVLFESGTAASVRKRLLDDFNLHTVLHLPSGIFYATGIRTSVLFVSATEPTRHTWFYDLRNGNGSYGKKRPLTRADLDAFVTAYGPDPWGTAPREETARFRSIDRDELRRHDDRFDMAFERTGSASPGTPSEVLRRIMEELTSATSAIESIGELLQPIGGGLKKEDNSKEQQNGNRTA